MIGKPIFPESTRAYVSELPTALQDQFKIIRQLVFTTAEENPAIGQIEETVKWHQPAYLTSRSGSGTTIRLAAHTRSAEQLAVFVHCQTKLVSEYQSLFPDMFETDGSRALLIPPNESVQYEPLGVFIHMALTYHLKKP